ncbi:MAG: putative multidrug resistance protein EmrK [Chlamydiia bacterium]|nr:putative multidrug resistance protein EmrK [Chlamydiia bacterium]
MADSEEKTPKEQDPKKDPPKDQKSPNKPKDQLTDEQKAKKKRHMVLGILGLVFLVAGVIVLILYLTIWRYEDSTDDAYVHGNEVMIMPQVPGIITSINAEETMLVDEGSILVELDKTDRKIAYDKAKAHLAETTRMVQKMFERVVQLNNEVGVKEQQLIEAEVFFVDRSLLVDSGAVSQEAQIAAETKYFASEYALNATMMALFEAATMVQGTTIKTHPLVVQASEAVRRAWVDLQRCTIYAPATGIVSLRRAQVGESVSTSSPLMAIIPLDQMWIEANFKEIHLAQIRIGQAVEITADTYGDDVVYRGYVQGIAAGTGAAFSVLPPQNATGNWIKIVQRIPVRCTLPVEMLKRYPLRIGLSCHAKVDVRDEHGTRVPEVTQTASIYKTNVFAHQVDGADKIITQVVDENITHDISITDDFNVLVEKIEDMRLKVASTAKK